MTQNQRNKYLIRKYGITLEEYERKLKEQNDCCDLCGKHRSNYKKNLAVDHNHKTGQVRGLLCFFCNRRRVGQNNLDSATKLYAYMLKHEGNK